MESTGLSGRPKLVCESLSRLEVTIVPLMVSTAELLLSISGSPRLRCAPAFIEPMLLLRLATHSAGPVVKVANTLLSLSHAAPQFRTIGGRRMSRRPGHCTALDAGDEHQDRYCRLALVSGKPRRVLASARSLPGGVSKGSLEPLSRPYRRANPLPHRLLNRVPSPRMAAPTPHE